MSRSLLAMALVVGLTTSAVGQGPPPGQPTPGKPVPRQPAAPQTPPRPGMPARDQQVARKGTAVLKGQVVDGRTGTPVRRARIFAMGSEPMGNAPSAQTDAEGRFELRELVAGKYSIDVTKSGYLSLVASNGGKRPPPLEVADGQTVEKIVIALSKGGVISGQVLDEFGDPMLGVEVRALRYQYMNGQRQLGNAPSGPFSFSTDDLGAFRIFGLAPGEYFVSARPGRDYMPYGPSTPNAEGPAPTFYPGTASPGEARRVAVRAGRETSGIVFAMTVTRLSRIRGRALSAAGDPFNGSVNIAMRDPLSFAGSNFGTGIRPDGSFEFNNLQPGTYVISAQPNYSGRELEGGEFARAVVTVNAEDINDLLLVGGPGGVARGRLVTDDGTPIPFPPKSVSIMAQPLDSRAPSMNRGPTPVREDGTFEITGLFDRLHLRPMLMGPAAAGGWNVKSVMVDGQDTIDTGIEFQSGRAVEGIEIVYTRKASRLTGQLQDARGGGPDAWVVLFPSDESKWTPMSRFVRASRAGPGGKYSVGAVPFDDYLVVAVTGLEDGQWQDPEFLRSVKPLATSLSIAEGEVKTHNPSLVDWRR